MTDKFIEHQSNAGKGNLRKYGATYFKELTLKSLKVKFERGQISQKAYDLNVERITKEIEQLKANS